MSLSVKRNHRLALNLFHRLQETVRVDIPSRLDCVPATVKYLTSIAAQLGLLDLEESNLPVALDEALTNAVVHGNHRDEDKLVQVLAVFTPKKMKIVIRDQGKGFDFRSLPHPLSEEQIHKTHGRGIFLVRSLVDEVRFNRAGNQITLIHHACRDPKPRTASAKTPLETAQSGKTS